MKLLILGGTVFLGRALAAEALARGHELTLFNRGVHNPHLFPEAERLTGDRDGDLTALAGRTWDAVIDPSGYVPRIVRRSAELLAPSVGHYTFISSISVYADTSRPGMDESTPLATLADPASEDVAAGYGALKALCEQAAEAALPGRALNVRAGLIVGPHDQSGRFTYWPERLARGGDVVAPAPPDGPAQFIDVRDLAAWILDATETGQTGAFNVTSPPRHFTFGDVVETCRAVAGGDARVHWIDPEFLVGHEVAPWSDLPLWVPDGPERMGFLRVSTARAEQAGLRLRPLAETVRDTLAWSRSSEAAGSARPGLSPEREAEVLRAWRGRGG